MVNWWFWRGGKCYLEMIHYIYIHIENQVMFKGSMYLKPPFGSILGLGESISQRFELKYTNWTVAIPLFSSP